MKNIIAKYISKPNPELLLNETNNRITIFKYFIDNNIKDLNLFNNLFNFLYNHYFFYLV